MGERVLPMPEDRVPSLVRAQTKHANMGSKKKQFLRDYDDVLMIKIWTQMNIRIYLNQKIYTNEYPNIFM